jgi:signal transduction histidine kinase
LEQDDFWQALKGIVKSTTVGTTLHTTFETQGKVPVLPPAWQEHLLRIGQEALTTTLKYVRAKHFGNRMFGTRSTVETHLQCVALFGTSFLGFAPGYPETQLRC